MSEPLAERLRGIYKTACRHCDHFVPDAAGAKDRRAAADRIEELERELAIVDAALSAACSDAWSDADGARRSYIDTARAEAANASSEPKGASRPVSEEKGR